MRERIFVTDLSVAHEKGIAQLAEWHAEWTAARAGVTSVGAVRMAPSPFDLLQMVRVAYEDTLAAMVHRTGSPHLDDPEALEEHLRRYQRHVVEMSRQIQKRKLGSGLIEATRR